MAVTHVRKHQNGTIFSSWLGGGGFAAECGGQPCTERNRNSSPVINRLFSYILRFMKISILKSVDTWLPKEYLYWKVMILKAFRRRIRIFN
jgi:hypothetical protein